MKFSLDSAEGRYQVVEYTSEQVVVVHTPDVDSSPVRQPLLASAILSPNRLVPDWAPRHAAEVTEQDFDKVFDLAPELVLYGSGRRINFPDTNLIRRFADRNLGFEVMDTPAACRTFNVLMMEGRMVVAALIIGDAQADLLREPTNR
jgi:uncharacterized protein